MGEKNKLWNFSNQVHDNMFWSLGSGVAQLTFYLIITMWLMANGYAPTITATSNPIWFVLSLILLPIFSAFHFYWIHRLLHVPLLYKRVHSLHHRNVSVGPWSGLANGSRTIYQKYWPLPIAVWLAQPRQPRGYILSASIILPHQPVTEAPAAVQDRS